MYRSHLRSLFAAVAVCCLVASPVARGATASVLVSGPKGERTITAADLQAMPRTQVVLSDHGKRATFEGVSLYALLEQVGAPAGEALRGGDLTRYVIIEAADGYRVVFSLAELSPSFTDRRTILAVRRDGEAIPAAAGPFQIAVENEKRMGRCVRQVTSVRVVEAK